MTKMYVTSVLPGERFVTGPFGDVGYIAKRPGHGAYVNKLLETRAQNRLNTLHVKEQVRDSKRAAVLNEFYRRFDQLSLRASVNRMVELGVQEADEYFKIKQNKLRQLFLEDQSGFVQEYTRKAQTSTEEMLAREKQKADEVVKGKSNEDELRAQQIYLEMAMKNSDEFKEKLRMANLKNESEGRREQIRVKQYHKRLEQEENAIWDAIREDEYKKARLQKDQQDEAAAKSKLELLESLNKQVMDEELSRKKNLCIESIQDEQNGEIRRKWEEHYSRRDEEALRREALHHEALKKANRNEPTPGREKTGGRIAH
uniref:Trichohyalin-plectin-homology domain-containing protein n=1 Tax=Lygus hesperus TaxID=30085 RepID=A0A0A9Z2T6_LYGHE